MSVFSSSLNPSPGRERRLTFQAMTFRALALLRQSTKLCTDEGLALETSANILFTAFSISTSTLRRDPGGGGGVLGRKLGGGKPLTLSNPDSIQETKL